MFLQNFESLVVKIGPLQLSHLANSLPALLYALSLSSVLSPFFNGEAAYSSLVSLLGVLGSRAYHQRVQTPSRFIPLGSLFIGDCPLLCSQFLRVHIVLPMDIGHLLFRSSPGYDRKS